MNSPAISRDRQLPPETAAAISDAPAPAGMWEWDFDSGSMTWSHGLYDLLGVDRRAQGACYDLFLTRLHPDERGRVPKWLAAIDGAGTTLKAQLRVLGAGGAVHLVAVHGEIYRDPQGRPSWAAGALFDITAIREAQTQLMRQGEEQALLSVMSAAGPWRAAPDGRMTQAPFWMAFTGQTLDQCRDFGWLPAIHPDDVVEVASTWAEAVHLGSATEFSFRARHHSGDFRWLMARATPLRGAAGEVLEWIGSIQDIQVTREAEDSRRLHGACLRIAAESAQIVTWAYDLESGRSALSEGGSSILGLIWNSPDDSGCTVHGEDAARLLRAIQRIGESGESCDEEFRVLCVQGETRWLHVRAELIGPARLEVGHVIGVTRDVTLARDLQRRAQEEHHELARLRARLDTLGGLAGIVTWTATAAGRMTDMPGWEALTGQSPEEALGSGWLAAVHTADRERLRQAIHDMVESGAGIEIEYRVRHHRGHHHWMRSTSAPVLDEEERVSGWVGVCKMVAAPDVEPQAGGALPEIQALAMDELQLVSGAQVRAARGLLRWGVRELAEASGASASTIRRIEEGDSVPESRDARLLHAVRAAFSRAGVQFFRAPDGSGAVSLNRLRDAAPAGSHPEYPATRDGGRAADVDFGPYADPPPPPDAVPAARPGHGAALARDAA